jgi:putative ABC transport system permease protein
VSKLALKQLWSRKRRAIGAGVAVIIGVAFLVGTMALGDSMTKGIDMLMTEGYSGTDVEVRSVHQIDSEELQTVPIDAALADQLAALPEVGQVVPVAEGTAQVLAADGARIGGNGPPTSGTTWPESPRNPFVLTEGRAPAGPDEVVLDVEAAAEGDYAIGDTVTVLVPEPIEATLVGTAEFASGSSLSGVTFTWFDLPTAQQLMLGSTSELSYVDLIAAPGVSPEQLQDAVADVIPADAEALTNTELVDEAMEEMESDFLGFFKTFLLAFALVALLVGCFSISNTFSILVAQRTRESALLRALGASRRQVLTSVTFEALLIGAVASALGIAAGVGLAYGLNALMTAAGFGVPSSAMGAGTDVVVTGIVVGVGMTLLAAVLPAWRAARVAPLAALRDVAVDRSGFAWWRALVGVLAAGGGVTAMVLATESGAPLQIAGLGALATFVGFVLLGPVVARGAAGAIGGPIASVAGVNGKLARRNAMRNPKRTSGTAAALMIGTAVVALFASLATSIKHSMSDLLDETFGGDMVVRADGFSGAGLPLGLTDELAALPEVAIASPLRDSPITIVDDAPATGDGRDDEWVVAGDMATMGRVIDLGDVAGDLAGTGAGEIAVSTEWAADHGAALGAPITVEFADGTVEQLTVTATYTETALMGDLLVDGSVTDPHEADPTNFLVMLELADGVSVDDGKAAIATVTDGYGRPLLETADEYVEAIASELDQMLLLVYGLLGIAVIIALIGIANTLSLSLHERTRELGLLRAVGQNRRALRATVRWESVIVAIFGTVGGLALGTFMCWGLIRAIAVSEGFGRFAPSYVTLTIVLGVAVVAGVLAAARPARRAAKLDVLAAISTD